MTFKNKHDLVEAIDFQNHKKTACWKHSSPIYHIIIIDQSNKKMFLNFKVVKNGVVKSQRIWFFTFCEFHFGSVKLADFDTKFHGDLTVSTQILTLSVYKISLRLDLDSTSVKMLTV